MEPYFYLSTKIYFGREVLQRAGEIGKRARNCLIVSGKAFARKTGLLAKLKSILKKAGLKAFIFSEVEPDPSVETVERGGDFCRKNKCDCILGIGGGSALDTAKGIAAMAKNKGGLRDCFGEDKFKEEPLPVVAIPTTAGTGSEVTRYAVITDWKIPTKKTVRSYRILPCLSLLDPSLTLSMPPSLTADTGMDAFSHALESYLSPKANPLIDLLAIEAMKIIKRDLPQVFKQGGNLALRENMLYASMLAGMAINRTGTIIVHGMGYGLTLKYRIPHGRANALLLGPVCAYLQEKSTFYQQRLEYLGKMLGVKNFKYFLNKLNVSLNIARNLKEAKVKEQDLNLLAQRAIVDCQRSLKNMAVKLNLQDFQKIYGEIYGVMP